MRPHAVPDATTARSPEPASLWDATAVACTPQEFVERADALLAALCRLLHGERDHTALLSNLAACLRTTGREAALPLAQLGLNTIFHRHLAQRAESIGDHIVSWAARMHQVRASAASDSGSPAERLEIAGACDGHIWQPEVVAMLSRCEAPERAMGLYNEWLHQLLLLRDSLLAFDDWQEVRIPLPRLSRGQGLREFDRPHRAFVHNVLHSPVPDERLLHFARPFYRPSSSQAAERRTPRAALPAGRAIDKLLRARVLDLDLLRAFIAVVDLGGFTAAANALHRTQAAVSTQIKRLEEALALQLLQRSTRSLMLTAEGHILLDYARRMLTLNEEAIVQLHGKQRRDDEPCRQP